MNLAAVPLAQELFTGNGRIYQCGIYYPRRHRMHWRCAFSRAVWKCKHGNAESIRECVSSASQSEAYGRGFNHGW